MVYRCSISSNSPAFIHAASGSYRYRSPCCNCAMLGCSGTDRGSWAEAVREVASCCGWLTDSSNTSSMVPVHLPCASTCSPWHTTFMPSCPAPAVGWLLRCSITSSSSLHSLLTDTMCTWLTHGAMSATALRQSSMGDSLSITICAFCISSVFSSFTLGVQLSMAKVRPPCWSRRAGSAKIMVAGGMLCR